MKKLCACLKA